MPNAFGLCCNFCACKCACTVGVRFPMGGWGGGGPSLGNRPPGGGGGPSSLGWGRTRGGGEQVWCQFPLPPGGRRVLHGRAQPPSTRVLLNNSASPGGGGSDTPHPPPLQVIGQIFLRIFGQSKFFSAACSASQFRPSASLTTQGFLRGAPSHSPPPPPRKTLPSPALPGDNHTGGGGYTSQNFCISNLVQKIRMQFVRCF